MQGTSTAYGRPGRPPNETDLIMHDGTQAALQVMAVRIGAAPEAHRHMPEPCHPLAKNTVIVDMLGSMYRERAIW